MHAIEQLASLLKREVPEAELHLDLPRNGGSPDLAAWLDVHLEDRHIAVEARGGGDFGISLLPDQREEPLAGLFQGPDRVAATQTEALQLIASLLRAGKETLSPSVRHAAIAR